MIKNFITPELLKTLENAQAAVESMNRFSNAPLIDHSKVQQTVAAITTAEESVAQTELLKESNRYALEANEIAWRAEERARLAEAKAVLAEADAALARRSSVLANVIAVLAIAISIREYIFSGVLYVYSFFQ